MTTAPSLPESVPPLVSVILSFRNEEEVLPELIRRLGAALTSASVRYELIFINDDSTDASRALLEERARQDGRIKLVNMSRRFGLAECIMAGMRHASGDAVVTMDTDLQDPPELLPEMIGKWQDGAEVVYTVRARRAGEPAYKLLLTRWAYHFINMVANTHLPIEAGDFKLMSRRVADELTRLDEKDPYIRGLVTWIGFKQVPVLYDRQPRFKGTTHFPIFGSKGPIITFVTGVTSFSMIPLTCFLALGLAVCALAVTGGLFALVRALAGLPVGGWLAVGSVLLFVSGVQLLGLGIIGIYLGRVYSDVRNRPRYIVESTMGFDAPASAHSVSASRGSVAEKVLLTGGTGFVGTHLREELARRGVLAVSFSRSEHDLTRQEDADEVFRAHHDAGVVIHLACVQAAGDFPARHPADQFRLNHLIHVNVLHAWKEHLPHARLIAMGSSCAYPGTATHLTEDTILTGPPHESVYSYAATKRALLTGIRAYNDQYGLMGSYVIPPTLFGEHDDFHPATAHVVGALVGRVVRAVREKQPSVEIWGDGTQVREFLYVKDFVVALLHLSSRCDRDVVNVGPGCGTSIRQLAETIREAAGYTGELLFNPQRYTGIQEKVLDVTRLRERYGCSAPADLRPGIARTVAWYDKNYERIKDRPKSPCTP